MTATITPNNTTDKTLAWESSDEQVATVNNGTVTALTVGTTTITAKTIDGSNKIATCNITVGE